MKKQIKDAVIIGGGAAGLFAAGHAAQFGMDVVVIEKNRELGRKLAITGKGRCNVTNDATVREIMDAMTKNGKFLWSCLTAFPPEKAIEFFEYNGVPIKTERGRRAFPMSDRSEDIVSALVSFCKDNGVKFIRGCADGITTERGKVTGVTGDFGKLEARNVIICTGGMSYPGTGSTGDGYKFAKELGHKIVPCRGSLVPLISDDDDCSQMQGFAPKNVKLSLYSEKDKLIFEDFGEMLFTHFGVSGPLVLSASAHMKDVGRGYILIDFKPALDEEKLDLRILRDFKKYSNREFQNALGELVAKSMIPVVVERSGIDPETKVNSITREQRKNLISVLKKFRVNVTGTRPIAEAIITSGGVDTTQIDPKTMESKLVEGLYFAGEVIDVDAYTGGYNLQIAWSTAYAAATHLKGME